MLIILSDKQITAISQGTWENLVAGDDGYLTTRRNVAKAQARLTAGDILEELKRMVLLPGGSTILLGRYIESLQQDVEVK